MVCLTFCVNCVYLRRSGILVKVMGFTPRCGLGSQFYHLRAVGPKGWKPRFVPPCRG